MSANRKTLLCRYHYDPLDRLADCTPSAQARTKKGEEPKLLSHPFIATQANSPNVISAGYMSRIANRIIITNKSGHYHLLATTYAPFNPIYKRLKKMPTSSETKVQPN